jgi:RNA polymerase sigma-70 factor, ECF subfamily
VVLPHLDNVYRMARNLARDNAEAEDLVQETFMRAFKAYPRFEMREHGVRPWLFKILHNAFYTLRGKARRQPRLLDDVSFDRFADERVGNDVHEVGTSSIDWDSIDQELKRAVESLQPEYREVLLLWSFEEMSYKDIASVCECAIGTVMSRLYRARKILAEKLAEFARTENVPKKSS